MIDSIAFREYRKKSDVHGTVLYPAVMVAPVQKHILELLIDPEKKTSVFDPFHGSGTALYECASLSDNVRLFGCDINPLANLITKAKLRGVTKNIRKDIEVLSQSICEHVIQTPYIFPGIDKWFRRDVQLDLQIIRECIVTIPSKRNRLYFWCMFSDVVRKYSNTRSSTYKLHIKPNETIERMQNRVISDFIDSINKNISKFQKRPCDFTLYKGDSLQIMERMHSNRFDISITSPPYGDNATTVPYGQFSILQLYWIDKSDLELEGWEFESFSSIDSNSMGGKAKEIVIDQYGLSLLLPYLRIIAEEKHRKIIRFFNDYFLFLDYLSKVTKQYIVLTLGNRTVDRITIDLTEISWKYLENKGYTMEQVLERDIPVKRIPPKTSMVGDSPVKSINSEYVAIFKKKEYVSRRS